MKWYVLTSIAVAGTAVAAGLGYYFFKPRQDGEVDDSKLRFTGDHDPSVNQDAPQVSVRYSPAATPPASTSGFPLKRGSRGEYVKNLQNALIQKYGAAVLPKWGADGSWGSELESALKSNGLKTSIDQTTYTDYVTGNFQGEKSSSADAPKTTASTITNDIKNILVPTWIVDPKVAVGYKIFSAAKDKNLQGTIGLLKNLKNVTDYTSASQGFQLRPWKAQVTSNWIGIPTVEAARYTLVTGVLDAFTSQNDKNLLRAEFRRIGLKETIKNSDPAKYDSTWSLSGLGEAHRNIRTTMRAIISDGFNVRLEVPARTLLGQWLSSGNGYTRFRTHDGRDMYVRSNAIVFS